MLARKYLLLSIAVIAVGGLAFFSLRGKNTNNEVNISNLASCTKDISQSKTTELQSRLYKIVTAANDHNRVSSSSSYSATIRDSSCKTSVSAGVDTTTLIVDIPKAKQSWSISFRWIPTTSRAVADTGGITPSCVPSDELYYGDFKCNDIVPGLTQAANIDPIFKYIPHSTLDYSLTGASNGGQALLTAQLFLTAADQSNADAAATQYKQEVLDYITSVGLDPSKYTIDYAIVNQS